jgi:predicted DNA-binding transcriptional regulator YafY
LGEGYDLPPLMFKADEIEAVVLGLEWVKRQGDAALVRAAEDAIAKVGTILPKDLKPVLFDAGLVVPPSFRKIEDNIAVSQIRRAIRENRKIGFAYTREDGLSSTRTVWPLAIAYFEAVRLVIAHCELRQDFRTFRTDRMEDLNLLSEKYPARRKALLKEWLEREKCKN